MPYFKNDDLPDSIKAHLPQGAQTIYRKAFNKAYHTYGRDDEIIFKIAWVAVKKKYKKNRKTGKWVRRGKRIVAK